MSHIITTRKLKTMSNTANKNWVSRHKTLRVIILLLGLVIGGVTLSGCSDNEVKGNSTTQAETKTKSEEKPKEINYEAFDVDQLQNDLEANALKASDTYKDKYVELKGKLGNIDSSGEYFSIMSLNNEFEIIGIQCDIQNEEQRKAVSELNKDDVITVRGKITEVGELMGYALELHGVTKVQ